MSNISQNARETPKSATNSQLTVPRGAQINRQMTARGSARGASRSTSPFGAVSTPAFGLARPPSPSRSTWARGIALIVVPARDIERPMARPQAYTGLPDDRSPNNLHVDQ